jgi:hypothetical protein
VVDSLELLKIFVDVLLLHGRGTGPENVPVVGVSLDETMAFQD